MKRRKKSRDAQRKTRRSTRRKLGMQPLELRRLMAADMSLVDGYLHVSGTELDDLVEVYQEGEQVIVSAVERDASGADIDKATRTVREHFTIESEGCLKNFLGCEILRDEREETADCCHVLQPHLIEKLVKTFGELPKCERKTKTSVHQGQFKWCQRKMVTSQMKKNTTSLDQELECCCTC